MRRVAINETVTARDAAALLWTSARGGLALALGVVLMVASVPAAARAGVTAPPPAVIVRVHEASGLASAYFEATARPGTAVQAGSLQLVNPTGRTVRVRLNPVDALTTDTLGSAYALTASTHGPTPWIVLSDDRVTIPPRGEVSVAVAANVPRSAQPGDYLSGIAVEAIGAETSTQTAGGVAIGEIDRYAIGVELKLPGPRHEAIDFTGARVVRYPSALTFLLLARNAGNVILEGVHGQATISRAGHVVAAIALGPGTFVTGTSIAYPVAVPGEEPTEGTRYRVQATLRYGLGIAHLDTEVTFGHAAAATQQRYVVSPAAAAAGGGSGLTWAVVVLVLVLALVAAVGAVLVVALRRRRPLRGRAARVYLERTLAGASKTAPVSVVRIALNPTAGDGRRRARAVVRQRLRASDRVCDLDAQGVVVVLPATSEATAEGLAQDLAAALSREGVLLVGDRLPVATATAPTDPVWFIASVATPAVRTPA